MLELEQLEVDLCMSEHFSVARHERAGPSKDLDFNDPEQLASEVMAARRRWDAAEREYIQKHNCGSRRPPEVVASFFKKDIQLPAPRFVMSPPRSPSDAEEF